MADHDTPAAAPDGDAFRDLIQPFQVEASGLRGRLVRLGPAVDTILTRHDYPEPVARLLAEALALSGTLAAALKYDGVFTLQIKGDGPVKMLVADVTSAGAVRGYAAVDGPVPVETGPRAGSVPGVLGKGYLAFTVDQGEDTERYQGIVELTGDTLADCAHHYFEQSEQFSAAIRVSAGRDDDGAWRAAAMMLQRLPDQEAIIALEERDEAWRRAVILMNSVTGDELLDFALAPERLLYRLFHEDGVRVYERQALAFGCRCSRDRAGRILASLPRDEVTELTIDGEVTVTCEFCNTTEAFDEGQIDALF